MSSPKHIVVIGASAGGVEALSELVSLIPVDLKAAIFIVQHLSPNYFSQLPQILSRKSTLAVGFAVNEQRIEAGHIYVAPPDHHLLVDKDKIFVTRGPKENRFRPSIDALFRSAAYCHGPRVIGIVLSGALDDGTSGLWTIKRLNGKCIVQDPAEASFDSMPATALEQVDIDYCVSVREMGDLLNGLTQGPIKVPQVNETRLNEAAEMEGDQKRVGLEVSIATDGDAFRKGIMESAELTPFTCPECHGVLVQIQEGKIIRYRCHTGHGYSRSALLSEITEKVDESYWGAMKYLEEAAMLLNHMAKDLDEKGDGKAAGVFFEEERLATQHSHQLRDALLHRERYSMESLLKKAEEK